MARGGLTNPSPTGVTGEAVAVVLLRVREDGVRGVTDMRRFGMGLASSNTAIAKRYDRLAPVYRVIEIFFWLPPSLRSRAVELLNLPEGGRAVEVGCGSGRNLTHLVQAVGPSGSVLGTDISDGMIDRAQRLVRDRQWSNVVIRNEDAAALDAESGVDGILFSLSYSVIPERHAALQRAWGLLKPGGRLVILDSGTFTGLGKAVGRFGRTMSRYTVLGDPSIHPWEELAAVSPTTQHEFSTMGNYCLAWATREDITTRPHRPRRFTPTTPRTK